jgi:hypothetical protein
MKIFVKFKTLGRSFCIRTNSEFLAELIKRRYNSSEKIDNVDILSAIQCELKDPCNTKEAQQVLFNLLFNVLVDIENKYWIFHASGFCRGKEATMLLGNSDSGKSSIVFAKALASKSGIIDDDRILVNKRSSKLLYFHASIKVKNKIFDKLTGWFAKSKAVAGLQHNDSERVLYKEDLDRLNLFFVNSSTYLKNIVFLENKQNPVVVHLYQHCLNRKLDATNDLKSLNRLICKKNIAFLPSFEPYLQSKKKIYEYLKMLP